MTNVTPPAPKGARARIAELFGRKPAPPPTRPAPPPKDPRIAEMQAWPWAPIHDVETERFGPLTWHAGGRQHEDWSVRLYPEGLRVKCEAEPQCAITLGGDIDRQWQMQRITAEIKIDAIAARTGFVGLVVAETGGHQLMMGLVNGGELIVVKRRGVALEHLGQCIPVAHASGDRARITLQAMLFDASVILFANGDYLCTLTDASIISKSATIGLHLNGQCDATLTRLVIDAVGGRAP